MTETKTASAKLKNAFLIIQGNAECVVRKAEDEEQGFSVKVIVYLRNFEAEVTIGYQDDIGTRDAVYDAMEAGGLEKLKKIVDDMDAQISEHLK